MQESLVSGAGCRGCTTCSSAKQSARRILPRDRRSEAIRTSADRILVCLFHRCRPCRGAINCASLAEHGTEGATKHWKRDAWTQDSRPQLLRSSRRRLGQKTDLWCAWTLSRSASEQQVAEQLSSAYNCAVGQSATGSHAAVRATPILERCRNNERTAPRRPARSRQRGNRCSCNAADASFCEMRGH